jgi:hypothetical protein
MLQFKLASSAREEEATSSQLASPDLIGPITTPATLVTLLDVLAVTTVAGVVIGPIKSGEAS